MNTEEQLFMWCSGCFIILFTLRVCVCVCVCVRVRAKVEGAG